MRTQRSASPSCSPAVSRSPWPRRWARPRTPAPAARRPPRRRAAACARSRTSSSGASTAGPSSSRTSTRPGAAAKLTHLNYAFGGVAPEREPATSSASRPTPGPTTSARSAPARASTASPTPGAAAAAATSASCASSRRSTRELKVLMSLGGWTLSKYFSDAALTEQSRRTLVQSCVDLFIKGNLPTGAGAAAGVFDGFDLDWEWPGSDGNAGNVIRPEDKANFTCSLAEFRRQLDAYGRHDRASVPAERVPAGGAGEDLRRLRGQPDLQLPRLRHRAGLRLPRHLGDGHQPPVGDPGAGR